MRAYRIFASADAISRDMLERRCTSRSFLAGEALFHRGDVADEVFAIDSGRVKVWRTAKAGGQMTLGYVQQGDVLGMVGTTQGRRQSVSATAHSAVDATVWSGSLIRELAARDAGLAGGIATMLAQRTELMVNRLEEIFPASIGQRVARTLLRFSTIIGRREDDGAIGLPLSRGDLAELAHTTVPTVSRLMSRWRAAGIVDGRRGHIVLLDLDALHALSTTDT